MPVADDTVARRRRAPTRRYEARRNAIVASAVEEVNRKGVRGMTLGDVAARLDLVPTGVIYYFRNKEELAAAASCGPSSGFDALIAEAAGRRRRPRADRAVSCAPTSTSSAAQSRRRGRAVPGVQRRARAEQRAGNTAYVDMFRHLPATCSRPAGAACPGCDRNARAHLLLSEVFWIGGLAATKPEEDYPRVAERMAGSWPTGCGARRRLAPAVRIPCLTRDDDPRAEASAELFLRAATELINEEGYHGASVERISARLNVSKGAFYHHNETKDELVVACFERTFEIMWRAIHAAEAGAARA